MPAPYDYSLGQVADPSQSFIQGLQQGVGIQQLQAQQLQQQAELEQKRQQAQVINSLIANRSPTADDYARATLAVPGMREQLKQSWSMQSEAQQQSSLQQVGQVQAALTAGRPDIAADLLRKRSAALRNSGAPERESQVAETMAQMVEAHPEFARALIGMQLAALPGGDKLIENLGKLGTEQRAQEQAPAALKKLQGEAAEAGSKAETAAVTAKYAEPAALRELELKGWNVENIKSEIGYRKESNRIAAMNAAANREGNDLKRQELRLKIQETQQKLDESVRDKAATAEAAATAIDNSLNTIERIKKNKSLNDVLGSIEGRLPSVLSDDGADAIALIETLGSQAFLAQIPSMKGQGALSNAEGEKLQSALTNLRRTQSEAQFRANLDEAARLMKKGRDNLAKRYGVPLGSPDTPAAPGARPPLDSFFK